MSRPEPGRSPAGGGTSTRCVRALGATLVVLAASGAGCEGDPLNRAALDEALAKARPDNAPPVHRGVAPPLLGAAPTVATVQLFYRLRGPEVGGRQSVAATCTIRRAGAGAYEIHWHRSWQGPGGAADGVDEGAEARFDGHRLAQRRNGGPWYERETWRGDAVTLHRQSYDLLLPLLDAFEPYLSWRDGEPMEVAGLRGRWREGSLRAGVAPKPMSQAEERALRENDTTWTAWLAATHRPQELSVRVARRAGGAELLGLQLQASGVAKVGGIAGRFGLEATLTVRPEEAGSPPIELPKDVLPAVRERPWRAVRDVLKDALRPIYRRDAR